MKKPLLASVALHIAVVVAILVDLPMWFSSPRPLPEDAPIIVDLSQIKISEMTNLPKQRTKKTTKENPVKKNETKVVKVKETPKPELKKEKTPEKPADVKLEEAKKEPETKKKPEPKPKKKEVPKDNGIKNLLASVEKIKENLEKETPPETPEDKNKGIAGGQEGSYMQDLTISEKDALAAKLRSCWNLDPGVKGIADMIVEVSAGLSPEGAVNTVKIMDNYRYNHDEAFRSVAESARRAVLICGNMGEESPFVLLAKRHPDKYSLWQNMRLYFNPLDGGVK